MLHGGKREVGCAGGLGEGETQAKANDKDEDGTETAPLLLQTIRLFPNDTNLAKP